MATSTRLQNPDAIKTWLEGLGAPGAAGDAFAATLADAAALVDAGHRIAIDEHPRGRADVLDLSADVAYVHGHVSSPHLGPTLKALAKKAAQAPAGFARAIHIDARHNRHLAGLDSVGLQAALARAKVTGVEVSVATDAGVVRVDA